VIAFGWGAQSRSTYLAQTTDTDANQWLQVCIGDNCSWDGFTLPPGVAAEAQAAAQLAASCVAGG